MLFFVVTVAHSADGQHGQIHENTFAIVVFFRNQIQFCSNCSCVRACVCTRVWVSSGICHSPAAFLLPELISLELLRRPSPCARTKYTRSVSSFSTVQTTGFHLACWWFHALLIRFSSQGSAVDLFLRVSLKNFQHDVLFVNLPEIYLFFWLICYTLKLTRAFLFSQTDFKSYSHFFRSVISNWDQRAQPEISSGKKFHHPPFATVLHTHIHWFFNLVG